MINVKITMVDGSEYNVRNIADNIQDFYKRVMAPYGTNMTYVEIVKGDIINTGNIVSIREMSDEEVEEMNKPEKMVDITNTKVEEMNKPEEEVITGLTDTEVVVEDLENAPEDIQ